MKAIIDINHTAIDYLYACALYAQFFIILKELLNVA